MGGGGDGIPFLALSWEHNRMHGHIAQFVIVELTCSPKVLRFDIELPRGRLSARCHLNGRVCRKGSFKI